MCISLMEGRGNRLGGLIVKNIVFRLTIQNKPKYIFCNDGTLEQYKSKRLQR